MGWERLMTLVSGDNLNDFEHHVMININELLIVDIKQTYK